MDKQLSYDLASWQKSQGNSYIWLNANIIPFSPWILNLLYRRDYLLIVNIRFYFWYSVFGIVPDRVFCVKSVKILHFLPLKNPENHPKVRVKIIVSHENFIKSPAQKWNWCTKKKNENPFKNVQIWQNSKNFSHETVFFSSRKIRESALE